MSITCYKYLVNSTTGGSWYGNKCQGGSAGGTLLPSSPIYTDCVLEGSLILSNAEILSSVVCGEFNETPTQTPSPTATPILSPSTTQTPTVTPTVSLTPSNTPTISVTPSPSSLSCVSGITLGQYYFTDCCGVFQQGFSDGDVFLFNPTLPSFNITAVSGNVTVVCPTPTTTPTPSVTPTTTPQISPTQTQTTTPTPTATPTLTCSLSGFYQLVNPCKPFTLFDMGVDCYVIQSPTTPTSFDGILSVNVTGGTPPYSFYWSSGDRDQTLYNIPAGSYQVLVVDYYGDYSSTTVCDLVGPTSTPTPTVTQTQTPTPTLFVPDLCLTILTTISAQTIYQQFTFTPNGLLNGRLSWISGSKVMSWNSVLNRWEVSNWPYLGTPISTTQATIPVSGWAIAGPQTSQSTVSVVAGSCPNNLPLTYTLETQASSCAGITNCSGSVICNPLGGVPPYTYSLDGVNFQASNIFSELCPGTYQFVVQDSLGFGQTQQVVIQSLAVPSTYTTSILVDRIETPNANTRIMYWSLVVNPIIPSGTTVSVNLNFNIAQTILGPFYNNDPLQTATITNSTQIFKDGVQLSGPVSTSATTITSDRPNCSPEQQFQTLYQQNLVVSVGRNNVVSGITISNVSVPNPVSAPNSCISRATQSILITTQNPQYVSCSCCSFVSDTTSQGIQNHTVDGVLNQPPCSSYSVVLSNGQPLVTVRWNACGTGNQVSQTFYGSGTFCAVTGSPQIILGSGNISLIGNCLS